MPSRVLFTVEARDDLRRAIQRLSHPGAGRRAERAKERIANAFETLRHHPLRYGAQEHPGVREWPIEGHRIMYVVATTIDAEGNELPGEVIVLRVFLPRQLRDRL